MECVSWWGVYRCQAVILLTLCRLDLELHFCSSLNVYLKNKAWKPEYEGTLSVTQSINGFLTGPTKHRPRGGGLQTLHKEVQSDHSRHKMTRRLRNMSSKRHGTRERCRITVKSVLVVQGSKHNIYCGLNIQPKYKNTFKMSPQMYCYQKYK